MSINPYAAPAEQQPEPTDESRIAIDVFTMQDAGFTGSVLTQAEVVGGLRDELAKYCSELGYQVVPAAPDASCYQLRGQLNRVDQGSRFLRWLLPGLLGAVIVEGNCQLIQGNNIIRQFTFYQRKALGFQGGNTRGLIETSLRQIALQVGSDVGITTGRITTDDSSRATQYLWRMLGVVAFVSAIIALAAYMWATQQPVRKDGVAAAFKPAWAAVVMLFVFASLTILATAAAPTDVLTSRTLLFLRSLSGVRTISAQRIVIALLALGPIGLLLLTFMVL